MKSIDRTEYILKRAKNLSYWSYTGLLIPLLGIIFGVMTYSAVNKIKAENDKEQEAIDAIKKNANAGIVFSLIVAVALAFFIISVVTKAQQTAKAQTQQQQALQSCETGVHQQWDSIIDTEMGLDKSLAYQDQGLEQDALNSCQSQYVPN